MKNFIFLLFIICNSALFAQQNLPISFGKTKSHANDTIGGFTKQKGSEDVKHFALYGVGNISNEALEKLNGGGKLAIGFCPAPIEDSDRGKYTRFFASYNKNASNNDSLMTSTLIFPEVGDHSFLITAMVVKQRPWKNNLLRHRGFFGEFVMKQVESRKDTANFKSAEFLKFNTLHYTAGYRYGFSKNKEDGGKTNSMGVNASLFISYVNVPDEDDNAFERLTGQNADKNDFWAAGIKFTAEINGFQIFTDLRQVFGSEKSLPLKELKGFNANIGVAFATDILRF